MKHLVLKQDEHGKWAVEYNSKMLGHGYSDLSVESYPARTILVQSFDGG